MKKYLKISILVDNPKSWFNKYLDILFGLVQKYDPDYKFIRNMRYGGRGDVLFILSCDRILTEEQLTRHKNNIVIHASDLPKGRGWSPWTWQVESGENVIPLTLFEASAECDAGDYYIKDLVRLDGTELVDEIRDKIALKIINMVSKYLADYPMSGVPQRGKATHYRKRTSSDCEIDISKSIKSQFNKLRVVDNEKYPAYFRYKQKKYMIKVFKSK
jgi:methionyl-tRNA formyltransferase